MGIKGFLETSFVDWHGKICAVLFLGGCNFRCPFCHNHRLALNPDGMEDVPWPAVVSRLDRLRGWVDGVCITGGEPTLHPQLSLMVLALKEMGFQVKLDTNGSHPRVLEALAGRGLLDAVSMDVKAPLREAAYAQCAGVPVSVERIRRSMGVLERRVPEAEFRTTVVPGLLGEEEILAIAGALPPTGTYRLLGFRNQDVLDPALRFVDPYPDAVLESLRDKTASLRRELAAGRSGRRRGPGGERRDGVGSSRRHPAGGGCARAASSPHSLPDRPPRPL